MVEAANSMGKNRIFWDSVKVLSTWNFEVLGHQLTVSDIKTLDMCPFDTAGDFFVVHVGMQYLG